MESPARVLAGKASLRGDLGNNGEQALSTILYVGGQFIVADADSLAVMDTGATADSVCLKWSGHRNKIS